MSELRAPRRVASLSAQLVDTLRELIASGTWPVGMRIPPEHDLVEQLGVGRTTVREAIGALVHLGLLEARKGDGTYVRASNEMHSVLMRRTTTSERGDVLELRAVLEEYASARAAARRTDDDLVQLERLLDEAESAADPATAAAADARFHRAVVRACGNTLLTELYDTLSVAVTEQIGAMPWVPETAAAHARLHRGLVAAIAARDEVGARHYAAEIVQLTENGTEPQE
ncbi:FadR/GntR family transcriptional regulator [Nocardia brasiliensis]|uniref:GntR family transcriptional regulator n=1 Tax=Nocardia brasiliensis (strain ATCC 700358 / HUJEG-1) TaxID=1133849 RepID=K0EZU1_NOCB7|nr:FCD domain-containing protein [Nocardia brasiliensis]AFU02619.1 GntR family transcriptional regulator [Nocardia brasiliensis ATCC 700358]OCF84746.1 GntR family transcriptional regulator [Nocardia brasiliensis]